MRCDVWLLESMIACTMNTAYESFVISVLRRRNQSNGKNEEKAESMYFLFVFYLTFQSQRRAHLFSSTCSRSGSSKSSMVSFRECARLLVFNKMQRKMERERKRIKITVIIIIKLLSLVFINSTFSMPTLYIVGMLCRCSSLHTYTSSCASVCVNKVNTRIQKKARKIEREREA